MTASDFNTIFNDYRYIIYRYACRFVNETDAEDIAANTFVKLWEAKPIFQNKTALSQWLHIVTKNKCFDLIKLKKHHRGLFNYSEINEIEEEIEDYNESIVRIEKEVLEHILSEVNKLPTRERDTFKLKYFKHYSVPEIAAMLNLSNQTIHNQIHNAIKKLRHMIKEPSIYLIMFFALS